MKTKRIFIAILSSVIILSFTACGGAENTQSSVVETTVKETMVEETKLIETTVPQTTAKKEESQINDNLAEVSADFKATMESYEAFFDEYAEFMKKYSETDDVTVLLAEYTEYVSKLADYTQKLDEIDEDSLSDADLAYYLEVQNRINKKLLEVAY